jgi:hypothetical protein
MRSSCISHPSREPLVKVHQWQIEACDGNWCAAALLSFFEYWHNWKLDELDRNRQLQELAYRQGQEIDLETESTLQFHTEIDLELGLMGMYKRRSIRESLKQLEQKRFITICRNPNPKYSFDNKKYFQFEVANVQRWIDSRQPLTPQQVLEGISAANLNQKKDKPGPHGKNTSCGKFAGTITEITNLLYSKPQNPTNTTGVEEKAANAVGAINGVAYRTVEGEGEKSRLKLQAQKLLDQTLLSKNIAVAIDRLPVEEVEDALQVMKSKIAAGMPQEKRVRYFVGILKRKIDPTLNEKPKSKPDQKLSKDQLRKMHVTRQRMESCDLNELCVPIRIKKGDEWIEAAFGGLFEDDHNEVYDCVCYYLYTEYEGKRYVDSYSSKSDQLCEVEVYLP